SRWRPARHRNRSTAGGGSEADDPLLWRRPRHSFRGTMASDQEKHVRAFYEALAPGHREPLLGLQSAHVVYELPEGMRAGARRCEGMEAVPARFLPSFYAAFDARFMPEETISQGDEVVVIGRLKGRTRASGVPIDVPFVHVWTVAPHVLTRLRGFID